MGSQDTTAQVHPELLTKALLHAAEKAAGTTVRIATVDGIELGDDNRVQGGQHACLAARTAPVAVVAGNFNAGGCYMM